MIKTLDNKQIINYCVRNNIKSISILDSWGNYEERFFYKKKQYIPDHIIVNDLENYKQLKKIGIKKTKIFIGGNPIIQKHIIKFEKNKYINNTAITQITSANKIKSISYKELIDQSTKVSQLLLKLGIQSKDKIYISISDSINFITSFFKI